MDSSRTKRAISSIEDGEAAPLSFDPESALTRSFSSLRRPDVFDPGTTLHGGRYRIEEVLGRGGEGVVYRAYDRSLEHDVALKVLHLSERSAAPQLKREFRFLQDLIHPALVRLHELVVDRTCSFFTMSLIEGDNFLEAARDEATLRSLLGQLAGVLAFLHGTGRVHRDIKATNVLVRKDGSVVLLDFGIGLNLSRPTKEPTRLVGTPRYMAPELLLGKPATPKCDAYSLGVLAFEALTGRHPQKSERTELSRQETFHPSEICPGVSQDLDELCALLLEPDPEKRAGVDAVWDLAAPLSRRSELRRLRPSADSDWFMGRTLELRLLEEALERTDELFQPVVALVEAESGMGKTAFLSHFLQQDGEWVVFRGKCSEHELVSHKAFDGVIEDLVEYLSDRSVDELLELLPPSEGMILVQLFPEFGRLPTLCEYPPGSAPLKDFRALRTRAYLALAGVLGRLSDEVSLIIALDDLQWGDEDSVALLREVFMGCDRPNCLLILAYRTKEKLQSPCLKSLLQGQRALTSQLMTTTVSLSPLKDPEAHALVAALSRDFPLSKDLEQRLVDEAEGSPLLLTELVSHLRDTKGDIEAHSMGILGIVLHRLQCLPEQFKDAFELLCCSGKPLSLALISQLCNLEANEILHQLSHLRLARMRRGGRELEVFHDSMRESVWAHLGPKRTLLHGALARALVARGGDEAEIARHFASCNNNTAASQWAERAAVRASRSLALTQAAKLYQFAIEQERTDPTRKDALREKLADVLADAGRSAEAAPLFETLSRHATPGRAMGLLRKAAEHYMNSGYVERALTLLAYAQAALGLCWPHDEDEAARLLASERLRLNVAHAPVIPNVRSTEIRNTESASKEEQLQACRVGCTVGFASTIFASASSARYLRHALANKDARHLPMSLGMEAISRATLGPSHREVVQKLKAQMRALTPSPSDPFHQAFLQFVDAQCAFLMGTLKGSVESFEAVERSLLEDCRTINWALNACRASWSDALWLCGRFREGETLLTSWENDALDRADLCLHALAKLGRARLEIVFQGDPEQAERLVHEAVARWRFPGAGSGYVAFRERHALAFISACSKDPFSTLGKTTDLGRWLGATHLASSAMASTEVAIADGYAAIEVAAEAKSLHERRACTTRALARATTLERIGIPWAPAFALQIRASAALVLRPTTEALSMLSEAAEAMQRFGLQLHQAAILARLGELQGGDGGRELIEQGHAAFADLEAFDWVAALSGFTPRILAR